MSRYIDAGKLEAELLWKKAEANEAKMCLTENDFADLIHDAETADCAPVVHAFWIRSTYVPDGTPAYVCSRCGRDEADKEPYCNCGAKMDEDGDDE